MDTMVLSSWNIDIDLLDLQTKFIYRLKKDIDIRSLFTSVYTWEEQFSIIDICIVEHLDYRNEIFHEIDDWFKVRLVKSLNSAKIEVKLFTIIQYLSEHYYVLSQIIDYMKSKDQCSETLYQLETFFSSINRIIWSIYPDFWFTNLDSSFLSFVWLFAHVDNKEALLNIVLSNDHHQLHSIVIIIDQIMLEIKSIYLLWNY